jgi:hypothetical protein
MKPRTVAKLLPISKSLAGFLFIIASGIFPDLARGGGEEFHVTGVVYSIVYPYSVAGDLGQICVIEDQSGRRRTVKFSTADQQRWLAISYIHPGDHVTIDYVIMGDERSFNTIRIDSSGGTSGNPTASPESTVSH